MVREVTTLLGAKRHYQGRPSGDPGRHEDAGADHGTDIHYGGTESAQITCEVNGPVLGCLPSHRFNT